MGLLDEDTNKYSHKKCAWFKKEPGYCGNMRYSSSGYCKDCDKLRRQLRSAETVKFIEDSLEQIEEFKHSLSDQEKLRVTIFAMRNMMKVIKKVHPNMYENYKYLIIPGMEE